MMRGKLVLPNIVNLTIRPVRRGRLRIVYTETFPHFNQKEFKRLTARTVAAATKMMVSQGRENLLKRIEFTCDMKTRTAGIIMTGSRVEVASCVLSEFLCWLKGPVYEAANELFAENLPKDEPTS